MPATKSLHKPRNTHVQKLDTAATRLGNVDEGRHARDVVVEDGPVDGRRAGLVGGLQRRGGEVLEEDLEDICGWSGEVGHGVRVR
jgi:hypothetical protein